MAALPFTFDAHAFPPARAHRPDADEIAATLAGCIGELAERLTGERPTNKTRNELRFGQRGSLSVVTGGNKRGTWFDHEADEGGGPLKLIGHLRRCDFPAALAWARDYLGDAPVTHLPVIRQAPANDAADAGEDRRIGKARSLWNAATPIAGTVAERYLSDTRGIPMPAAGWPHDTIRAYPNSPGLVVAATNYAGEVQAVQHISLTADAQKNERNRLAKKTGGVQRWAAVHLPGPADGPLLLAEGPETGLSVWAATGHETWVALGSIGKLVPPADRRVIVCRDDDRARSPADVKINRLLAAWPHALVATPWDAPRHDGSDFNDLIRAEGAEAVRARIAAAASAMPAAVPVRCERVPLDEGRSQLWQGIGAFYSAVAAWDPEVPHPAAPFLARHGILATMMRNEYFPVWAVGVTTGGGKTEAALQHAAALLHDMRARGDTRTVMVAVPTHRLSGEIAARFMALPAAREASLAAAVWRGRRASDPSGGAGEQMCKDPEALMDFEPVAAGWRSTQGSLCERIVNRKKQLCPLFHGCPYQAQFEVKADLWIISHARLFSRPQEHFGDIAALIVDEDVSLKTVDDDRELTISDLRRRDPVLVDGFMDEAQTAELRGLRMRIADVFESAPDGPLARDMIVAAGMTCADVERAAYLEELRYIDPEMMPGMSRKARKARAKQAAPNRTLPGCRTVWRAIATMLDDPTIDATGHIDLVTTAEDGRIVLTGIPKRPNDIWPIPTLLMSATFEAELIRRAFPAAEFKADIRIAAPHQHVLVARRRNYTKSALLESATRLREVHALAQWAGIWFGDGQVLIIAQKDVEQFLTGEEGLPGRKAGSLPALRRNVATAHFGDLEGIDQYKNVRCIVTIGCPRESVWGVERLARRLTGRAGIVLAGNFLSALDTEECSDGVWRIVADIWHPDETAESVRRVISRGGNTQAIGRGRGVNRTAENPLTVIALGGPPGAAPVSATLEESFEHPSPRDLMLATRGFAVTNARHASELFPELWASHNAARIALSREQSVSNAYNNSYRKLTHSAPDEAAPDLASKLHRAEYQLAGPRNKPYEAVWDPTMCPDPRGMLVAALGPLAFFLHTYAPPKPEPLLWGMMTRGEFDARLEQVGRMLAAGRVRSMADMPPPCAAIWNSDAIDAATAKLERPAEAEAA